MVYQYLFQGFIVYEIVRVLRKLNNPGSQMLSKFPKRWGLINTAI